jgi:hypothetical protein
VTTTEHGLLVAFGRLAEQIGLREAFARVPIKMKTIDHSPADKLAELLAHILAGGLHLQEVRCWPPTGARSSARRRWRSWSSTSI